ncbi:uncharacterized protein LOC129594849 [Paramacrobiotus metropolitanus]|uniref:uncharacterized protein LOC129594849 n=1 Tax=Paramacrobiotus metropolitanus TaxID=2943436 RepID=UPI0024458FE9|nr:uncharacterized protein LOC129594849 [Paramacrobiotus metropolitanus]
MQKVPKLSALTLSRPYQFSQLYHVDLSMNSLNFLSRPILDTLPITNDSNIFMANNAFCPADTSTICACCAVKDFVSWAHELANRTVSRPFSLIFTCGTASTTSYWSVESAGELLPPLEQYGCCTNPAAQDCFPTTATPRTTVRTTARTTARTTVRTTPRGTPAPTKPTEEDDDTTKPVKPEGPGGAAVTDHRTSGSMLMGWGSHRRSCPRTLSQEPELIPVLTQQPPAPAPSAPITANPTDDQATGRPALVKERITRRVPHGARRAVAASFEKAIKNAVHHNDEQHWVTLLSFASQVLAVPESPDGARKVSLATLMKQAVADYESGTKRPLSRRKKKKPKKPKDPNGDLVRRVGIKIDDGDCSGAVRILMSTDAIAETSREVLDIMADKHPQSPLPDRPGVTASTPSVTADEVRHAILSFRRGSAAGPDGLLPQHLLDMLGKVQDDVSASFCKSLAQLLDIIIQGNIPDSVRPYFFGAKLIALRKKDGGLRPIAVGNTLRRLTAKVICRRVKGRSTAALQPSQLGFGINGGAEAIVHSAREFLSSDPDQVKVLLKIDLKNAFNCISRATVMEVASVHLPEYANYLYACYGHYSELYLDDEVLSSQSGIHQGDPLGPLLFSLGILPFTSKLKATFNAWFLDDGTLGGSVETVAADFQTVIDTAHASGLSVNMSKCEIFVCGGSCVEREAAVKTFLDRFPTVSVAAPENLCLLGAPLTKNGITSTI